MAAELRVTHGRNKTRLFELARKRMEFKKIIRFFQIKFKDVCFPKRKSIEVKFQIYSEIQCANTCNNEPAGCNTKDTQILSNIFISK